MQVTQRVAGLNVETDMGVGKGWFKGHKFGKVQIVNCYSVGLTSNEGQLQIDS